MPNQFLSDEFGDIEDYFVTDYWLIDQFVGDQLFTWGNNNSGQLGNFNNTSISTPVTTFAGGTTWKSVAGGGYTTSAIKTDGSLWLWGSGGQGRLGTNDETSRNTPVTTFAGGTNWKSVSPGGSHTTAIKTDGTLWIWGRNYNFSVLGINRNSELGQITPITTFAGGTNWKQVSASDRFTAAIKTDGTLWMWGRNTAGQLGTNDTNTKSTPVTTFAGGNNWKQVSAGKDHTVAIKTDGSLWTWGNGVDGKLGTNDANTRTTPVTTFAGGNNWKQVSAGGNTAAIKTDGSLWTWGTNNNVQLGINNTDTNRLTPVTTFAGGTNWKQVSAGNDHTVAIKTDGSLWVWGLRNEGRLGNNDNTGNRSIPVTTFAGGNNWKSVIAGGSHTLAVKSGLNVDLS